MLHRGAWKWKASQSCCTSLPGLGYFTAAESVPAGCPAHLGVEKRACAGAGALDGYDLTAVDVDVSAVRSKREAHTAGSPAANAGRSAWRSPRLGVTVHAR